MSYYYLPPDTVQTLVLLWVFTFLAMSLMGLRLLMRKIRGQKLDLADKLTAVCMICLMSRLAFIHVVLVWGSNNVPPSYRERHIFSDTEIYQREIGSMLTIVSRPFYNTYLWLQKSVVLVLYQRILSGVHHHKIIMKIYWAILGVTYIIVQIAVFTDCRPIYLYWQVVPDPGTCSQAIGELVILGGLNIFTDILLILLPMPTLFRVKQSVGSKFRLLSLFSLGIFLVIITVVRLPFNIHDSGMQINRTTWASVESFTAAFVANIPTLYTLRRALPEKTAALEHGGRQEVQGWSEINKSPISVSQSPGALTPATTNPSPGPKKHILAKKSIEIQERRKAMFIPPVPPKDDVPGGWDRKARIKGGKVEYTGGEEFDEKMERMSVDSLRIFHPKI
ncbi:hypothetical protein G7Y89_g3313 [Cudoniella acicularis]|uniref:Rhodopsin domain-containing protein n=1 Tax=Cudoniella acicularis TaxID=354080 RepID=A0A8H4W7S5_9HELO|nr:hypothetical protein G7Y89_g3313 [Cudoniella acicularis]